ncbi:MAG: hypothetical protein JXR76_30555 [Deltaproteobacteria bacterium]|nr:hypothetical protein [Deltaproteobacteria bacterium]
MKRIGIILTVLVMCIGGSACNLLQKESAEPKDENKDSAKAEVAVPAPEEAVGEGLTEDEAKALLRDERVKAGTEISGSDLENELLRLQEELTADIEGREPDFERVGVQQELKPLVAKETFSPDNASSPTAYERDMAVMKFIREYVEKKKEQEVDSEKASADAATPKTE